MSGLDKGGGTVQESCRKRYRKAGFSVLPLRLDSGTCRKLSKALETWAGPDPETNAYGILRNNVWQEVEAFRETLYSVPLGQAAAELMEATHAVLFQDNVIWKPPGTDRIVQWHQDFAYWPLDRPAGVTMWIALEDCDLENGCMRYLPETHLEGERRATNFVEGSHPPESSGLPAMEWEGRERDAVPMELGRGQIVAHHPLLWHMSGPNPSGRSRKGWSLTWLAPETLWDPGHAPHPFNHWLSPKPGAPVHGPAFPRFPCGREATPAHP